jgi:hypothetical protein
MPLTENQEFYRVWRVDTGRQAAQLETVPETWQNLGGRALTARILLDEVPPLCHPLGPNNKLVFASGLLVGHMLSSCDRISVGGKSPLTGGVKEANAGGSTGLQMAALGIKALILEGAPEGMPLQVMHIVSYGRSFRARLVIWRAWACMNAPPVAGALRQEGRHGPDRAGWRDGSECSRHPEPG